MSDSKPAPLPLDYHVRIAWDAMMTVEEALRKKHPSGISQIWYVYRVCDELLISVRVTDNLERWYSKDLEEKTESYCVKHASVHVDEPVYDSLMRHLLKHVVSFLNQWTHNGGEMPADPEKFCYLIYNEGNMPSNLARLMLYHPDIDLSKEIFNIHREGA